MTRHTQPKVAVSDVIFPWWISPCQNSKILIILLNNIFPLKGSWEQNDLTGHQEDLRKIKNDKESKSTQIYDK